MDNNAENNNLDIVLDGGESPSGKKKNARKAKAPKKPMKRSTRRILIVLFVLLLAVFLFCGYQLYQIVETYYTSRKANNELASMVVSKTSEDSGTYSERTVAHTYVTQRPVMEGEEVSPEGRIVSPGEETVVRREHSPIDVDFDVLLDINTEVKGWLYSPDTVINYGVVQAGNNDYYLHRLVDKSYNPGGALFIDYRCAGDFSGRNTIIYGHHMGDGSMLASICDYQSQEYYDKHPVMYLNTPDGNYRLDIVCGFITYFDSRAYIYEFNSRTEFDEWFSLMHSYSDFQSDVTVGGDDRLVTLSTCTYEYDNARYVLMAKLVPID